MADEPAAPPRGARVVRQDEAAADGKMSNVDIEEPSESSAAARHDQLPSPEEYKATTSPSSRSSSRRHKRLKTSLLICIPICIIFAAIIIISLAFTGKSNKAESSSSSIRPTTGDGLLSRFETMASFVVQQGWSDETAVQTEETPQFRAALWVADYDNKQIPVDEASLDLQQRYALAVLYFSLGGRAWSRDTGFLTDVDVCDWYEQQQQQKQQATNGNSTAPETAYLGVDCRCGDTTTADPLESAPVGAPPCQDSVVKRIRIPDAQLDGTIPNEIALLNDLEELDLRNNYISGPFPEAVRYMTKLHTINLQFNTLVGELPTWLGEMTNVKTLNLASNRLTGLLPAGMATSMTSLRVLNLDDNQLDGTLEQLRGMSNVHALFLGRNQFSGPLSAELLATWSGLDVLDINDNNLNGELPANLFTQEHLAVIDLHGNDFTGAIPVVDVDSYDSSSIVFLALQGNQLNGPIPPSLGRLQRLYHLDLAYNSLTGQIPIELGLLKELKYLFLAYNNFDADPIPAFIESLTNLVDLSLQSTQRTGTIPDFLGNLDKLWLLDLGKNQLSGGIPSALTNCVELRFLILYDNLLAGEVPANIRNLQNLHYLILDGNAISGEVNEYCSPALPAIESFRMTCNKAVATETEPYCPCCDCCGEDGVDCDNDNTAWYGDFDPAWNTEYVRDKYTFHNDDHSPYIVAPGEGYRAGEAGSPTVGLPDGSYNPGDSGSDTTPSNPNAPVVVTDPTNPAVDDPMNPTDDDPTDPDGTTTIETGGFDLP